MRFHLMLYRVQSSTLSTNTNNVDWHCWNFYQIQDRRSCKAWRLKKATKPLSLSQCWNDHEYNASKTCSTCLHSIIHPRIRKFVKCTWITVINNGTPLCHTRIAQHTQLGATAGTVTYKSHNALPWRALVPVNAGIHSSTDVMVGWNFVQCAIVKLRKYHLHCEAKPNWPKLTLFKKEVSLEAIQANNNFIHVNKLLSNSHFHSWLNGWYKELNPILLKAMYNRQPVNFFFYLFPLPCAFVIRAISKCYQTYNEVLGAQDQQAANPTDLLTSMIGLYPLI
jgi:hypothetical protein